VQPHVSEEVRVDLENATLNKISEVVGYEGKDGDELVDVVNGLAVGNKERDEDTARLWEIARELGLDAEQASGEDVYQGVRDLNVAIRQLVDESARFKSERVRHGEFMVALREILGVAVSPVDELLDMVRTLSNSVPECKDMDADPDVVRSLFGDSRILEKGAVDLAVMQTAAHLEDLQRKVAVVCRHLGVVGIDDAIVHVAHTEALVEELDRRFGLSFDGWELNSDDDATDYKGKLSRILENRPNAKEVRVEAATALIDICRHCGVIEVGEAIQHVAHSEAILDDLMGIVGEFAASPSDIPRLIKTQAEVLLNMRTNLQAKQDHIGVLADQLSEDEQKRLANEQVFARIREVIGVDDVANGDLPTTIDRIIYDVHGMQMVRRMSNASVDGHLLDMALVAMRGKITGLDPDRIAMLREAA